MDKWIKRWQIEGTRGDIYTVALDRDGNFGCSCPVWKFRRQECKHILKLKYITGINGQPVIQKIDPYPQMTATEVSLIKHTSRKFAFD